MPGRARGSPDPVIGQELGVEKGPDRCQMADRGNTANGKACFRADQPGIGLARSEERRVGKECRL